MSNPVSLSLARLTTLLNAGLPLPIAQSMTTHASGERHDAHVHALLRLGLTTGAPLLPALERMRDVHVSLARSDDEVNASLAGPRLAKRIVLTMPAVALLMATALGLNPWGTLVGTPLGWACAVIGAFLVWLAQRWIARLERTARDFPLTSGLLVEAVAIGVDAGLPLTVAHTQARVALGSGNVTSEDEVLLTNTLALARATGAPVAKELRRAAERARADTHAARMRAARELGERILVPMGACLLPAFMLWSVVPVAYGMLRGVTSGT